MTRVTSSVMKLVCVEPFPVPYRTAILNELNKLSPISVIYLSAAPPTRAFNDVWATKPGFRYRNWRSLDLRRQDNDFRASLTLGVSALLSREEHDIIVVSSWGPVAWEAVLWGRLRGKGVVCWAESTSYSGLMRGWVSTALRRWFIRRIDSFVCNGKDSLEYIKELGILHSRVVVSRYGTELIPDPIIDSRSYDEVRFLFVGRLIDRKRPLQLIASFKRVLESHPDATLTIVGDGPLVSEVVDATKGCSNVILAGRLEGEALHATYRDHDVLVMPATREVWGLVVNEALRHGLYVIATDQVGARELLTDESGVVIAADDWNALDHALEEAIGVAHDPEVRERRAASIADCTPEAFASDLLVAANLAYAHRGRTRDD